MSRVYFSRLSPQDSLEEIIPFLLENSNVFHKLEKGDFCAVKIHVGEYGNWTHVPPRLIREIVVFLKEHLEVRPFLVDTCVCYPGERGNALSHLKTAQSHGFTPTAIGAPFIVGDGLKGNDGISVKCNGGLKEIKVAQMIAEADALISVAHFKGHTLAGVGGTVKNLAMGCVTKESKLKQHKVLEVVTDDKRCQGCLSCQIDCYFQAITLRNGISEVNHERCMRCGSCIQTCPLRALSMQKKEEFINALCSAASGVLSLFDKKVFINVATNITERCDCLSTAGDIITSKSGIFLSNDPLAIDLASIDFLEDALNRLIELHGIDPRIIKQFGTQLDLGNTTYKRINIRK